jgi:hypothetical protein
VLLPGANFSLMELPAAFGHFVCLLDQRFRLFQSVFRLK